MRFIFASIFLFITLNSYCQSKSIYLELNDKFLNDNDPQKIGAYELLLKISNSENDDKDYFKFLLNVNPDKTFDENGLEITVPKILTIEKLEKKSFCRIHKLLSDSNPIYLVKKIGENKYKSWACMYIGTYRNIVITKPGRI